MHHEIANLALGLRCATCNTPMGTITHEQFMKYLIAEAVACQKCKAAIDVFGVIEQCIEENFFFNDVFAFVGAKRSLFTFQLDLKSSTTLTFSDYGIPKGARILHINYTPQNGGLFPLEFHGNSPYRGAPRDSVVLYPAKFPHDGAAATAVSVMVTWIESGSLEDVSLKSLVDAFEEYSREELVTSIVPANTSIEFDVMRYAESVLESISSQNSVKEFFNSGVSYVPTLKVLIPLLAARKSFPTMPKNLLSSLVELASVRNQIAHTGYPKVALSKKVLSKYLAGVVIGKWYVSILRNK